MLICHVCTAVVDMWVRLQLNIALQISNPPSIGKHSPVSTRRANDQRPFALLNYQQDHCDPGR